MGRWTLLISFLHLILHVSSSSELPVQTVDVKHTVILHCNGTVSKDTRPQEYDVEWKTEKNILVAHYQQGELTAGEWFKGRVSISEDDIGVGNFSLTISPVEYSDGDLYMCFWRRKHICDVKLEVLVPSMVSAQLGEPATLPCYVQVDKTQKSNVDTAHWKKDGETVLDFQSGLFNKSSGCENRCSMSVDKIKYGDLSLTIPEVRYSDRGTYQCFTDKTVKPEEIILTTEGNKRPWVLLLGVLLLGVLLLGVMVGCLLKGLLLGGLVGVKRWFCHTQMEPVSQHSTAEDSEPPREMASLAPGQPVQENGEEEQLRAPVCESGDTEDKRGPQPWNDDFCI
ncbi:uncharacterized protein LOC125720610 [Brienomyrus brachyistius]|uniref:uncharacterized protein LOC125720610 n=1 Tax=Brienomyrus brachyistius TaxID=42636 RepID=UPI0020B28339|nr:uncharacterized protein LOC125720610 [Brienomyrus brachyistius]XP_048852207.1 uncharacterized protein LOC125720610 [Brienomyrus brachyistius]